MLESARAERRLKCAAIETEDMGRGDDFDGTDAKKWSKFDGLFGVFIVLNAIVLGLEVDNPDIPFYQKPGTLF